MNFSMSYYCRKNTFHYNMEIVIVVVISYIMITCIIIQ